MNYRSLLFSSVCTILLFLSPSVTFGTVPGREINIWVYAPSANNSIWQSWYSSFEKHRDNVTGFSPCTYLMDSTGTLIYQVPDPVLATNWTTQIVENIGIKAYPLIAANGGGMNRALANNTLGTLFIEATIQEAIKYQYSGYNIQIEEPGNSTIETEWLNYLNQWLIAYQPYNLTLSIITGSICRGKDWMNVDCGNYRLLHNNFSNFYVIPEATYEGEPSNWKDYMNDLVNGLGNTTAHLGMSSGLPPLTNPNNGCLPAALSRGIQSLYIWVNPPEDNDPSWDGFGYFLNANATNITVVE